MTAARKAGLATPEFHLSENGGLFVMKRFDIGAGGASCGFEDFCSLQALGTDGKYDAHLAIPLAKAREIIDRVVDAVDGVRNEVRRYMADHPGFVPVGEGMLAAWRAGVDGLSAHRPA